MKHIDTVSEKKSQQLGLELGIGLVLGLGFGSDTSVRDIRRSDASNAVFHLSLPILITNTAYRIRNRLVLLPIT